MNGPKGNLGLKTGVKLSQDRSQNLKQNQRLMMSPQMQQAINLLQMPVLELAAMIEAELEINPILEYASETGDLEEDIDETPAETSSGPEELRFETLDLISEIDEDFQGHFSDDTAPQTSTREDEKFRSFLESSITSEKSLFEYLLEQAKECFEHPQELTCAEFIIGNFSDRGFLEGSLEEICLLNGISLDLAQRVLEHIWEFDPPGIGARSIQESLLIQLRRKGKHSSFAYTIVEKHFDDMLHNRLPQIKKALGYPLEVIQHAIKTDISPLDLNPGLWLATPVVQTLTPDIDIQGENGVFNITVRDENLPPVRINPEYLEALKNPEYNSEAKTYINTKILSGKWLMRNIRQRNETLFKIAQSLLQKQSQFFGSASGPLTPLTMKTLANELNMHESTIARAVANKYLSCSRGILPLRSFFTNAYTDDSGTDISSQTIKNTLRDLLANEDRAKPLSDQKLSELIKTSTGIHCARRTIAKYRHELKVGSASQRKAYE